MVISACAGQVRKTRGEKAALSPARASMESLPQDLHSRRSHRTDCAYLAASPIVGSTAAIAFRRMKRALIIPIIGIALEHHHQVRRLDQPLPVTGPNPFTKMPGISAGAGACAISFPTQTVDG